MAPKRYVIVTLESMNLPLPTFTAPPNTELIARSYPFTTHEQLAERVGDANIILTTTRLTTALLDPAVTPNVQLIQILGTGTDNLDIAAAKARGITVQNIPGANIQSVAEHGLALFFAARRSSVRLTMKLAVQGEWMRGAAMVQHMVDKTGSMPPGLHDEVACILGFGGVGQYIAKMAQGLGMKVCVAERADVSLLSTSSPKVEGEAKFIDLEQIQHPHTAPRTPLKTAINSATVIFIACPLLPSTTKLISTNALAIMKPSAIVVNVARGPIVDEEAVAVALKEHQIAGYASDVFVTEPSDSKVSPLLALDPSEFNFVATPHVAWFSRQTLENLSKTLLESVEGWMNGEPKNLVS